MIIFKVRDDWEFKILSMDDWEEYEQFLFEMNLNMKHQK